MERELSTLRRISTLETLPMLLPPVPPVPPVPPMPASPAAPALPAAPLPPLPSHAASESAAAPNSNVYPRRAKTDVERKPEREPPREALSYCLLIMQSVWGRLAGHITRSD